MNRKKTITFGALAILLMTTMVAWPKQVVTRPFKGHSDIVIVWDTSSDNWTHEGIGEFTHIGRSTNSGSGSTVPFKGSGTLISANGEQLHWDINMHPTGGSIITMTGGTGRFEGAKGTVLQNIISEDVKVGENEVIIFSRSVTYIGTITY
jgi:hypothetical protein